MTEEISPTEYIYLTGFQRYLMRKLEEIEQSLKEIKTGKKNDR